MKKIISQYSFVVILGSSMLLLGIFAISTVMSSREYPAERISPEARLEAIRQSKSSFTILRDESKTITEDEGIGYAIQLIRLAVGKNVININECHTVLHLIGHQAYYVSEKNMDRLASFTDLLCGRAYQHGVEGEIVSASRDPIRDLKAYCSAIRQKLGESYCYHGVGHERMGRDLDVKKSLVYCDEVTKNPTDDPFECYKGVFSELAFLLQGIDSQTGAVLSQKPFIDFPYQHPLDFCSTLSHEYQQACGVQLSRIAIGTQDHETVLRGCTNVVYNLMLQQECVHNISAIFAQGGLNGRENVTVSVPTFLFSLAQPLRRSYILGAAQEFGAYQESGMPKDWQSFCSAFPSYDDRVFCKTQIK